MHCEIYCNSHPPLSLIRLRQQRDKYWQRQRGDILSPVRCCGVDSECLLIKAGCGVMDGWNVIIAERQRCVEMEADGRRRNTFRREIKRQKKERERKLKKGARWRGARRSQRPRRLQEGEGGVVWKACRQHLSVFLPLERRLPLSIPPTPSSLLIRPMVTDKQVEIFDKTRTRHTGTYWKRDWKKNPVFFPKVCPLL